MNQCKLCGYKLGNDDKRLNFLVDDGEGHEFNVSICWECIYRFQREIEAAIQDGYLPKSQ
jgi:hypothetical protein